nr:DUF3025 domain-containing protein [Trinickia violacea]
MDAARRDRGRGRAGGAAARRRGNRLATGLSVSSFERIDWSRPWFAPFAERGARWQRAALESEAAYLAELNRDACASGQTTGRGKPLAFIAQDDLPPGAAYEAHIGATGCVPTRRNLHDFFNALMWFTFPRIKAALNARQSEAIDELGIGPTRGGVRDTLTLFDENALLFATADPSLAEALRNFDWHTLLVENRSAWGERCEVRSFGHALLEKLIAPYKACTGHAWIVEVPNEYFSWSDAQQRALLDETTSASIEREPLASRMFAPLPVLGIPGWWPANDDPAFYDDKQVFRSGRRAR